MNIVRKPLSMRRPVFERSAITTGRGTPARTLRRPNRVSGVFSSPAALSTRLGSRIARIVATTNTTNA